MRCVTSISAVYFVPLVLFGNVIMLNLFLAILLGNFEKARNFGQKKKVFEAFREIMSNGRSLNQALDIILNEMSIYAKIKILKWDENMVNKIHNKGDSSIAQDLLENGAQFLSDDSAEENEMFNVNLSHRHLELSYMDNESDNPDQEGFEEKNNSKEIQEKKKRIYKKEQFEQAETNEKKPNAFADSGKNFEEDRVNDSDKGHHNCDLKKK